MNFGLTSSRYLALCFGRWLLLVLLVLAGIILMLELAELLRRAAGKEGATFAIVLGMALLKLPGTLLQILPFILLLATMGSQWQLLRQQEMVALRTAGLSVWQMMAPLWLVTLLVALLGLLVINPVAALLGRVYAVQEARYLDQAATLEVASGGLWLREQDAGRDVLLRADGVLSTDPLVLQDVMILLAEDEQRMARPAQRLDAQQAALRDGYWELQNVWRNRPDQVPERLTQLDLPTNLQRQTITSRIAPPTGVPFWALPSYIAALEQTGFPAERHHLLFLEGLALPFLLLAMTALAGGGIAVIPRLGQILHWLGIAVALGTLAFAGNQTLLALGEAQQLPLWLAAWSGPLMALFVGLGLLARHEDG